MAWRCSAVSRLSSVARSRWNSFSSVGLDERRQHLALLDRVARAHLVADVAGRDGEERRAHGRDHRALRGDVAHERTFGDRDDAQALARNRVFGGGPAAEQEAKYEDQQQRAGRDADRFLKRVRSGVDSTATSWASGPADRIVAGGRRIPPAESSGV